MFVSKLPTLTVAEAKGLESHATGPVSFRVALPYSPRVLSVTSFLRLDANSPCDTEWVPVEKWFDGFSFPLTTEELDSLPF